MNNNVRSSGGHLTKETEGPPSATCKITKITANNDSTIEKGRDLHVPVVVVGQLATLKQWMISLL